MAVSKWFDSATYMASKLKQVQKTNPSMTAEQLQKAFNDAGYAGPEGAQKHFMEYGQYEEVAPNAFFDYTEYYRAKAADYHKVADPKDVTDEQVAVIKKAFSDSHMSAWSHYQTYGNGEGVNPSNSFDTEAYLTAKLAAVNAAAKDGKLLTMADLKAAFQQAGVSALAHFMEFGGKGEGEVSQSYTGTIPEDFAVPADKKVKPSDEHVGVSVNLTKDVDIVSPETDVTALRTSDKNDTINGIVSSLTASRTLNPGDKIDGGSGDDTLALDMQGSFSGFTGEGGMKNVEHVVLTNKTSMTRDFAAKGVEGVVDYTLKGAVSLSQLADTNARVNVTERASGTATIGFAAKVTDGSNDEFTVGVSKLGTKVGDAEATRVAIATAGIENLNLVAISGENYVALNGNSAANVTVSGKGNLDLAKVGTGIKTFDASATTGNVAANLTDVAAAGQIASIRGGAGNDTIWVKADALRANAEINGGEGQDTLVLTSASAATKQLQMSDVETVMLGSLGGALTLAAGDTSGLATVVASDKLNNGVTFVDMGAVDMTVQLKGKNANSNTIRLDNSGSTKVVVDSPEKGASKTAPSVNDLDVTLSDSAAVDISVAEKMSYTGTITADKATSVTLAVAGALGGAAAVTAAEATGIEITSVANASSLALTANKAESLTVAAAADFTITGSLDVLQGLSVTTDKTFDASNVTLKNLAMANLSGPGSVNLGAIGTNAMEHGVEIIATGLSTNAAGAASLDIASITTKGQDISVNTTGVLGKVKLGAISTTTEGNVNLNFGKVTDIALAAITGKNVTIDASGVLVSTTYGGDISVGDTLVLSGSKIADNNWAATNSYEIMATSTKLDATINGGIGADTFEIETSVSGGSTITLKGDLGIGSNVAAIDGSNDSGSNTFNASEFKVGASGKMTITGGSGDDTIYAAADGKNILIGGAGADTFHLGGGDDAVKYTATGDFGGSGDASGGGLEHIKGFNDNGSDVIQFASALGGLTSGSDASAYTEVNVTGASVIAGKVNGFHVELGASEFGFDASDVASALSGVSGFTASGTANVAILAVSTGTDTFLWQYTESGTSTGAIDSAELKLIGVIDKVVDFAADDFAFVSA